MILGEAKDEEVMPVKRRVTSKIPRIRNKFNSLINKQITIHRLRETINTVKEKAIKEMKEDECISNRTKEELDKCYIRATRAMKSADKKCKKVRQGNLLFSKNIKQI